MKTLARLLIIVFALGLPGCATAPPTLQTPNASQAYDPAQVLVVVQGAVNVKRAGRSEFVPGMFGMVLRRGDLLRLDTGAQAKVACADLTLADASSGTGSVPCKAETSIISDPSTGSRVTAARSNTPADIPIIISPRRTRLLNQRPLLRWTPIQGVDTYTVSVQAGSTLWSGTVKGVSQVQYPADAPALTPGQAYKVVVIGGGRSSEDKLVPDLGFSIATADETNEIKAAETRIKSLGLSDGATQFLTAVLYATRKSEVRDNFNAEAIERLESLSTSLREPAVQRMLGDLYLKVGLLTLAEERYTQANDLSKKVNDIDGQATELQTLGTIYELLGNKDEAIKRLQDAIAWYQKLGDANAVSQLQEQLNRLKNP
jgi:hypothetical protein